MSAISVRVAVVPGQNVIGIELPNDDRQTVMLRDILDDKSWTQDQANLPMALGRDIAGATVIVDLAKMPRHFGQINNHCCAGNIPAQRHW